MALYLNGNKISNSMVVNGHIDITGNPVNISDFSFSNKINTTVPTVTKISDYEFALSFQDQTSSGYEQCLFKVTLPAGTYVAQIKASIDKNPPYFNQYTWGIYTSNSNANFTYSVKSEYSTYVPFIRTDTNEHTYQVPIIVKTDGYAYICFATADDNGDNATVTVSSLKIYPAISVEDGGGTPIPKLLSAQSRNISSIGSLTYTFTESGTFQYYAMFHYNGVIVSTDVTVKLNGVTVSPTLHTDAEIGGGGSWGWFCGEITINANDIISVENNSSHSNYPLQLFVLQNANISNFRLAGVTENNDNYFTLNTGDSFYLNVFQCGYWGSTVNNFNYEIGIYGNRSVMTPAGYSDYYYGFTWVITI